MVDYPGVAQQTITPWGEERCRLLGLCDFSKRNLTWDIEELSALISQHIVDYPDVAQQTITP